MKEDNGSSFDNKEIKKKLLNIFLRKKLPDCVEYINLLSRTIFTLNNESNQIRPHDKLGLPGGLIFLKKNIPTIIIPDIHARIDFFLNIMFYPLNGEIIINKLANRSLQVVCVGDGFHSEIRGIERWKNSFDEYKSDFKRHKHMDEEMCESLGVMEMVMEIKNAFPEHFHFLKGNHENIANERKEGNFPFKKFAFEGPMVLTYITKFYGMNFLSKYYLFEKNLPLFAVGKNFLISHAQPETFFKKNEIIEYRSNPDVIRGLTWTDNNMAEEGSITRMLNYYLEEDNFNNYYYFGGHRPVNNLFNIQAEGKYIQIHNPNKFIIAIIRENKEIQLENDIIELKNRTKEITDIYLN